MCCRWRQRRDCAWLCLVKLQVEEIFHLKIFCARTTLISGCVKGVLGDLHSVPLHRPLTLECVDADYNPNTASRTRASFVINDDVLAKTAAVTDVEVGELLCDTLEDAPDSTRLSFRVSSNEVGVCDEMLYAGALASRDPSYSSKQSGRPEPIGTCGPTSGHALAE